MRAMSREEIRAFLSHGTRTGKLAWVDRHGHPQVAPIWFVLDGEDLVFNTEETAGKAKALRREGRASLVVDDQEPPYSYVKVDGTISFDDDPERLRAVATEIGGRYMGADKADEFGARNGSPGELIVRLTPTRIVGHADISD